MGEAMSFSCSLIFPPSLILSSHRLCGHELHETARHVSIMLRRASSCNAYGSFSLKSLKLQFHFSFIGSEPGPSPLAQL